MLFEVYYIQTHQKLSVYSVTYIINEVTKKPQTLFLVYMQDKCEWIDSIYTFPTKQ